MKIKTLKAAVLLSLFFFTASVAGEKTTEDYVSDLNSSDSYLQIEACRHLGESKEVSAVESLIFLLEDENVDSHVKAASASALGSIGKQEGVPMLFCAVCRKIKTQLCVMHPFGLLPVCKTKKKKKI